MPGRKVTGFIRVLENMKFIFQAWKVMENPQYLEEVMEKSGNFVSWL